MSAQRGAGFLRKSISPPEFKMPEDSGFRVNVAIIGGGLAGDCWTPSCPIECPGDALKRGHFGGTKGASFSDPTSVSSLVLKGLGFVDRVRVKGLLVLDLGTGSGGG